MLFRSSVEFALKMEREIFVLPQRIGESEATNKLIQEGKAKVIYDIEKFVLEYVGHESLHVENISDEFILFCSKNPTYDDALARFPTRVFEAELNGEIGIRNGLLFLT